MTFEAFGTQEGLQKVASQALLTDVLQAVATMLLALNRNATTTFIIIVIVIFVHTFAVVVVVRAIALIQVKGVRLIVSLLLLLLTWVDRPLRVMLGVPMRVAAAIEAIPC